MRELFQNPVIARLIKILFLQKSPPFPSTNKKLNIRIQFEIYSMENEHPNWKLFPKPCYILLKGRHSTIIPANLFSDNVKNYILEFWTVTA